MEIEITHQQPTIDSRTNCVAVWSFRLHARDGDGYAFDIIEVRPEAQKPLAEWTRAEVEAFIEGAIAHDPRKRLDHLKQLATTRAHCKPDGDFSMEQLP